MKSIRRYLLTRLLAGLGILWLLASLALFGALRQGMRARLDAELKLLATETRFLLPEAGGMPSARLGLATTVNFFLPASGYYFEVWREDGIFSDRSPSLGRLHLPRPDAFGEDPRFWSDTLPTGEPVRLCAVRLPVPAPGRGGVADIVVARNREALDRALSLAAGGLAFVGVLGAALCVAFVIPALRLGLAPLSRLAEKAARVGNGDGTAAESFRRDTLPVELQSIATRLDDSLARLAQAYGRERAFSANVAHELRTPLAELRTICECAQRWPDRAGPEQFEEVLAIADRMQALVEHLLLLARLEGAAPQDARESVEICRLAEECWRPVSKTAAARRLVVVWNCAAATVHVHGAWLRLTVSNLFANAVAYTPPGGRIRVAAEGTGSGGFRLEVENTVEGLSRAELRHVFDRLWRGNAARDSDGHQGLGLSLAQAAAHAAGLRLDATLTPDGDAVVFTVTQ